MGIAQAPYALWVSDKDEDGNPLEPQFIDAAYALEPMLLQYRERELGCRSLAANLVQATVTAASRAVHSKPVENPLAYFYTAFRRKVDRYLASSKQEVAVQEDFIEDLGSRAFDRRQRRLLKIEFCCAS